MALRDSLGTNKALHVPFYQGRKTDFKQIITDMMDVKRRMLQMLIAEEFNLGQKQVNIACQYQGRYGVVRVTWKDTNLSTHPPFPLLPSLSHPSFAPSVTPSFLLSFLPYLNI